MSEKLILMATSSTDEHTYGPVQRILEDQGFSTVVYKSDKVLQGDERFSVHVHESGELAVSYEGADISPDNIHAAWYRKVGDFTLPDADENLSKQLYMNNEIRSLHGTIWPLYPQDVWLNAPERIVHAEQKLRQLLIARQVGFSVLDTLVTNEWTEVENLQSKANGPLVVKMIRGILSDNNQLKGLHTTPLTAFEIEQLRSYTIPFPGLFQPFADKKREWRVTAVGEDVFSAAIYTDENSKDDWRKHQLSGGVEFRDEYIGDEISGFCVQYLGELGLQYGAFDFVERHDGQIVFLECNPNGQYGWLVDMLGLPIHQSVASKLVSIARSH